MYMLIDSSSVAGSHFTNTRPSVNAREGMDLLLESHVIASEPREIDWYQDSKRFDDNSMDLVASSNDRGLSKSKTDLVSSEYSAKGAF